MFKVRISSKVGCLSKQLHPNTENVQRQYTILSNHFYKSETIVQGVCSYTVVCGEQRSTVEEWNGTTRIITAKGILQQIGRLLPLKYEGRGRKPHKKICREILYLGLNMMWKLHRPPYGKDQLCILNNTPCPLTRCLTLKKNLHKIIFICIYTSQQ